MQLPQIMTDFFDALNGKVVYPSDNLLHKTTGLLKNGMNSRDYG